MLSAMKLDFNGQINVSHLESFLYKSYTKKEEEEEEEEWEKEHNNELEKIQPTPTLCECGTWFLA